MGHEWKIGDWAEYEGERCIITNVLANGWVSGVGINPLETAFNTSMLNRLVHLPDCTGWDWQPPKPIEPPEGYRLLTKGETIQSGDLFLSSWNEWCETNSKGCSVSEITIYARKIPPQVRPMTRDEFLAAWKARNFCPLIDHEDDIDIVNQVTESDPEYDDETVSTYKHGWVSLATLSAFKFASDETFLTVEE